MDRFDSLFKQLSFLHQITEAEGDLPMPPANNAPPAGEPTAIAANPSNPAAGPTDLPPVSPEDNIETSNDEEQSNLLPGKKIQLIKLITLSFISNGLFSSAADSNVRESELRSIKINLNEPTTIGNAEKIEKNIITAIAKLQNIEPFEVAKNIGYVTSSSNKESSSKYISNSEFAQLIELARKALISDPNKTGNNDKFGIIDVEDINSSNAKETLDKLKSILGGEVV